MKKGSNVQIKCSYARGINEHDVQKLLILTEIAFYSPRRKFFNIKLILLILTYHRSFYHSEVK